MYSSQKKILAIFLTSSVLSFSAYADNYNTGEITFEGMVVNTPCNIAQESLTQTVSFGQISRKFLEAGNASEKKFSLEFTDCDLENYSKDKDGNPVALKSMDIVFSGQNYADDKHTMLSTSTGNRNNLGIGIDGIEFGVAKDLKPLMVNVTGDNKLTFTALAKAVNVANPVVEGKFNAVSNFRITYQ